MSTNTGGYKYSEGDLVIFNGNIWEVKYTFKRFGPGVNRLYNIYYLVRYENIHRYTADAFEDDLEVIFTT